MAEVPLCPNCGALRPNSFCGICGQNDRDYNDSIWNLAKSAIAEIFELDGRVGRSLKTILLNPGRLAVEFEANRRASFVNPFRLFLFTSIVWFFLFSVTFAIPKPDPGRLPPEHVREEMRLANAEIQSREAVAEGLVEVRNLLARHRVSKLDQLLDGPERSPRRVLTLFLASFIQSVPEWSTGRSLVVNVVVDMLHSPQEFAESAIENLPLTMFVLLPWYSLLLMMFYRSKQKRLAHHFVFAIHVHAFSFLVLSLTVLSPGDVRNESAWSIVWQITDTVLLVGLFVHTYFAFKRFYGDGATKTLFKYLLLGFFYLWGFIPAFTLVFGYTVAEYF